MSKDSSADQPGDAATNVEHADNVNVVPPAKEESDDQSDDNGKPDGVTDSSE
jgi:hypothetical protein